MTAYDIHYFDQKGDHRIFCTCARDVLHARHTVEDLVGKDLARITAIVPVDNFDW